MAKGFVQKILQPNDVGDWLNQRSDIFSEFVHIEPLKKFDELAKSFFNVYSLGLNTNRDAWIYNFNRNTCKDNISRMINVYNLQVDLVNEGSKLEKILCLFRGVVA